MKKTGIAILICIAAFSCRKENLPIENIPTGFLSRVLISGEPYQEFTYTSSGLINEVKSWGMYTNYIYNSSNLNHSLMVAAWFLNSFSILKTSHLAISNIITIQTIT